MRRYPGPSLLACLLVVATALSARTAEPDGVDDLLREATGAGQRGDAAAILRDVRLRYRRLRSFSATGETVVLVKGLGQEVATPTTFTMLLARPNRYRISWMQTAQAQGAPVLSGAAWRTAEGPHAYRSAPPGYAVERNDGTALGLGGVPSTGDAGIPSLFFKGKGGIADIRTPTLEGSEPVEGAECWIVSGSSIGNAITVWISQDSLLVLRHRSVPKLGPDDEKALEEQAAKNRHKIDAMWSKLGLDAQHSAEMRSMMVDMMRAFAQHAGAVDISTTVTYRNVVVDAAAASADFEFQVPAGIPRVDSLLQGLLPASSPREVRNIRPVPPGEDANAILAKVVARYRDLQAIAAEGSLVERVGTGGGEGTLRQTFTLAMRHPDRYRLTWSGTCSTSFDGGASRAVCPPGGALWNAGDGPYQYNGSAYARQRDDFLALAGAVGASGGATSGLPSFFRTGDRWIVELVNPVLEGLESIEGEDCWVISGSSRTSARRVLWISRERSLIVQHRWSQEPPPEHAAEMQREEEWALERMKDTARPEAREQIGLVADMQKVAAKHRGMFSGDTTLTYRNIRVDSAVSASELVFTVPDGTPLKASLLEDWLPPESSGTVPPGSAAPARSAMPAVSPAASAPASEVPPLGSAPR